MLVCCNAFSRDACKNLLFERCRKAVNFWLMSSDFFWFSITCLYSLVKEAIWARKRSSSLFAIIAFNRRELLQTNMVETSRAAIQIARLTGSRRRRSEE